MRQESGATYHKGQIVRCTCGCLGPQQVLKVDLSGDEPRYKIAYYNAIIGGRHWVTDHELLAL